MKTDRGERFRVIRGQQPSPSEETGGSRALPPFEEALLAHLDGLLGLALRLEKGRRDRAEDLVQEACLRAFRGYQAVRSVTGLRSWFFRILVNVHLTETERRRREPRTLDVELSEDLLSAVPEGGDLNLLSQALDGEVQQALDALPLSFRAVVWLADVEELSYQEIAAILNCPLGTVAFDFPSGGSRRWTASAA